MPVGPGGVGTPWYVYVPVAVAESGMPAELPEYEMLQVVVVKLPVMESPVICPVAGSPVAVPMPPSDTVKDLISGLLPLR